MSKTLTASSIIRRIRKVGGIRLAKDGHHIEVRKCSDLLRKLVKQEEECVRAILREERATKYVKEHGRNWCKTYPHSTTDAWAACNCASYGFPHIHSDAGPPVNCELETDVFEEIRALYRQKARG